MRNIYYTYHVATNNNPAMVVDLETIDAVHRHTGLSVLSIYENLLKGCRIKGWIITRTPLPKVKPERTPIKRGVIAHLPNGKVRTFSSQRICAKCLGVSETTIFKSLKNDLPDYRGNRYEYDYM